MENRDRDKMSKNTGSTPAGDVNRNTSSSSGQKSDSSVDFGQKVGRGENIESDTRRSGSIGSSGMQSDSGRSSGSSGIGSSSGRSDSSDLGHQGNTGNRGGNRGASGTGNESL